MNLSPTAIDVMLRPHRFRKQVDFLARLYGLDSNLPELVALKERTDTTPDDDPEGLRWLSQLNPHIACTFNGKTLAIPGQQHDKVLSHRSLIEYFLPGCLATAKRLDIWKNGTMTITVNGAYVTFVQLGGSYSRLDTVDYQQVADCANSFLDGLDLEGDRLVRLFDERTRRLQVVFVRGPNGLIRQRSQG